MAIKAFKRFQNDPVLSDLARRREIFRLDVASARKTALNKLKDKLKNEIKNELKDEYWEEARTQGVAQGISIGKEEGIAKGKTASFLQLVTCMIDEPADEMRERIQQLSSEEIDRLFNLVATRKIGTLADLMKQLP